ncbi:MAG: o-succinylbenzoate synthase [Flavobacteriaceae bacterium]|jgi:o-succinylbenzoate synthase
MQARFTKRTFQFKKPSGTSRGILTEKHAWFIELWEEEFPEVIGMGECSIIPGLSPDFIDFNSYEAMLSKVCFNIDQDLSRWPSIKFGVECAKLDLKHGGRGLIFKNAFSRGERSIPINGLIWMGHRTFMLDQIHEKIEQGFTTLKMKIGAIDFNSEVDLLRLIRAQSESLIIRVDANGAFSPTEAAAKLQALSNIGIHSIEQPIKQGQWKEMAALCKSTPLPIALDEELIGVNAMEDKVMLLNTINPQYIILKPSLHGGISGTKEWISLAEERSIKWWITSALESNVGLNAICQLAAEYDNPLPQGLGTGSLYTDNIPSNLSVKKGNISLINVD